MIALIYKPLRVVVQHFDVNYLVRAVLFNNFNHVFESNTIHRETAKSTT